MDMTENGKILDAVLFMDRDFTMHHGSLHLAEIDIRQDMEVTAVSIFRKIRRH